MGSKTASPYQCAIDAAKYADATYTLMAVATDNVGATSSTQRTLTIKHDGDPPRAQLEDPVAELANLRGLVKHQELRPCGERARQLPAPAAPLGGEWELKLAASTCSTADEDCC